MTDRKPLLTELRIPEFGVAQLEQVVTEIAVEYTTGSVAELAITMSDAKFAVTKAAGALSGSTVLFEGTSWQVGSVEAEMAEWGAQLVVRCRDPLAKKLRRTYRTSAERNVSPGQWVTGRVKAAGGRSVVQASSKRGTIAQSKNDSVLDIIDSLAGDLEWAWTSFDGTFLFASRYAAWQGKVPGRSTWPVTWQESAVTDALTAGWADSDDSSDNRAELDMELRYESGRRIRPWDRLRSTIPGAVGDWLVEAVSIVHDGVTPVAIKAAKPKPPSPKAGSSSKES